MKVRNILMGIVAMLSLSACETIIDIETDDFTNRITINAFLTPDTTVTAYITEAAGLKTFSTIALQSDYYSYEKVESPRDVMYMDTTISKSVLTEANVKLKVNGGNEYQMTYNPQYLTYDSEYVPKEGDEVEIIAESMSIPSTNGFRVKLDRASAKAVLPDKPKIEVVSKDVIYKELEYYTVEQDKTVGAGTNEFMAIDFWGEDSVMQIKLRITDPGNEKNYYRLAVRSVGASHKYSKNGDFEYVCVDLFKSSDQLFHDSSLDKSFGYTPAYFSNVFDDRLINGKTYEFTVESRKRKDSEITPFVIVELQQISHDMYQYMKDIEKFRISDFDLYENPLQITSNVNDGWGVFGAMNYDTHIVSF